MAMSVPKTGMTRFMKEGTRYMRGVDEAVLRNISACSELADTVRSSYGPSGMSKMVITALERLFVTNDAATILRELEVQHPAAKMLVLASKMMEQEVGDGTNGVIIFGASLLEHAEDLINMGLTPVEIAEGYELALEKALEKLPELVVEQVNDLKNEEQLRRAVQSSLASKQLGCEQVIAKLVTTAALQAMPANASHFSVDNVRVCKILGASVSASSVMQGMVFKRAPEGDVKKCNDAKIAVFTCPFDILQTDTKGTVLLNTANELLNFSKDEEESVKKQVDALCSAGVTCIVSGGKFGDLHLHHLNARGVMAVRMLSKFDLRRVCKLVGATAMTKIEIPTGEMIGHCNEVYSDEVGETEVIVFKQQDARGGVSTVIVRGSSENLMDDMERSIDDAVNTVKTLTKDGRLVAGAGAVELELARHVESVGERLAGLEQYAVKKFALALEALVKQIADNAGIGATDLLSRLYAAHQSGATNACIDLLDRRASEPDHSPESNPASKNIGDALNMGALDTFLCKWWQLRLACNAACTILKVDQIIMAKPAGGPKPRDAGHGMDNMDDDGMA